MRHLAKRNRLHSTNLQGTTMLTAPMPPGVPEDHKEIYMLPWQPTDVWAVVNYTPHFNRLSPAIADMKTFVEHYPQFRKLSGTMMNHIAQCHDIRITAAIEMSRMHVQQVQPNVRVQAGTRNSHRHWQITGTHGRCVWKGRVGESMKQLRLYQGSVYIPTGILFPHLQWFCVNWKFVLVHITWFYFKGYQRLQSIGWA